MFGISYRSRLKMRFFLTILLLVTFSFSNLGLAFAATGLTDNILLTPQTPEPEKPVFNPYKGRLELPDARSSNSQRFLNLEDGSITEEISLVPTFFRNGKGDWVPIETEIMPTYAEGFKYKNKANSFDILFGDNALVRFGKKTNWIEFQPVDRAEVSGEVYQNKITYASVYEGVYFQYSSLPDRVKEDIILNQYNGQNTFTFEVKTQNTEIKKDEKTGLLTLYDKKGQAYGYFVKPYMEDAKGSVSQDVYLTLKETQGGKTLLEVTADRDWLSQAQFPVKIDPTVVSGEPNYDVWKDTYIAQNTNASYPSETQLYTGYKDATKGSTRTYIQFMLPSLMSNARITSATLNLYQNRTVNSIRVDLYRVLSYWGPSSITWTSQPTLGTMESSVTGSTAGYWSWDITNLVKDWYSGAQGNFGMMLRNYTETADYRDFNSVNNGNNTPKIIINYTIEPLGFEDFWAYSEDNVNGYNGNLVLQSTDVAIPGRGLPVSFTRTYNSRSTYNGVFGYGWTTNVGAYLKISQDGPVTYVDGDGSEHIFSCRSDGTYTSPSGIDLTLTKNGSTYTLTHKDGTKQRSDYQY